MCFLMLVKITEEIIEEERGVLWCIKNDAEG